MIINGENLAFKLNDKMYHCALDITMDFIGGKWKCVVLWYLKSGKLRFTEIRHYMPEITEKMLSIQLKALEKDGLIERKVYGNKPPIRVEYMLSAFGRTIIPVIDAIAKWGRELGERNGVLVNIDQSKIADYRL
ncbi:helix-turn-helix domain-containing protein [Olivibacter ginsenosidimutans]|uniref:Helix-turn-helix domain-containing protein n=1 Tax=Olivibacter ginsenosidimutans TaxID=1176537 RepID=A0ABP9CEM3_9SPHI